MKTTLAEIIRNANSLFEFIVIERADDETEARAMSKDQTIMLWCVPNEILFDFDGEVAIGDLGLLSGLLNFSAYNTDDATLTVDWAKRKGRTVPVGLQFGDGKGAVSKFRLTNPATIDENKLPPTEQDIRWEIEFEPDRAKVQEFTQLAGLYGGLAKIFTPLVRNGNLHFLLGEETSSTHSAEMVFREDVASMRTGPTYAIDGLKSLLKLAAPYPYRMGFTSRGGIGINFDTPHAAYRFLLRPTK